MAHTLNLVVKKIFNCSSLNPILCKARKLVGTFKHSSSLSFKLAEAIKTFNSEGSSALNLYIDEGINSEEFDELEELIGEQYKERKKYLRTKLVQDMVTRWNSTLHMIKSIISSHTGV